MVTRSTEALFFLAEREEEPLWLFSVAGLSVKPSPFALAAIDPLLLNGLESPVAR